MPSGNNSGPIRVALVAGIVAVTLVAIASTLGIVVWGPTENSTPLIASVLGFAGTTIGSLAAVLVGVSAQRTAHDADAKVERLGKDLADW